MKATKATAQEHVVHLAAMEDPDDTFPGDGVCPTREEFDAVATSSYKYWSVPSHEAQQFDIEQHLLDLLTGVPLFSFHSNKRLSWVDSEWLYLKCRSEWETTKASACDVKIRNLFHHARLGLSTPIGYQHEEGTLKPTLSLGLGASPNMPCLIRAWCYILSCRWVERLAIAGQQAHLLQPTQLNFSNFWEIAVAGEWRAVVIRGEKTYYAPWSWSKVTSVPQ